MISPVLPPPILPIAPVIGRNPPPEAQFFQERQSDLKQLGESLQSGDSASAQQDFDNIQTLAQTGPFDGNAFAANPREQDFTEIGEALQSGDLSAAQQAFAQLQATFTSGRTSSPQISPDQVGADPGQGTILNSEPVAVQASTVNVVA